jgi:hypothetical protein
MTNGEVKMEKEEEENGKTVMEKAAMGKTARKRSGNKTGQYKKTALERNG